MTKRKKKLITFDTLTKSPHLSRMTVANIAKKTGKTERGVKTTLTRRGLKVADYDGRSAEEQWEEFDKQFPESKWSPATLFILVCIGIAIYFSYRYL